MGVYQGRITEIEPDAVWTEIPELAVDQAFPCRWLGTTLAVNDRVLVVNLNGAMEDLVVVGKLNGTIGESPTSDYYIALDTDGVPYYTNTITTIQLKLDTDNVPYYEE